LQEEFKIDEFFSKNKTLLKQIVSGDEYANIWFDVSRANRNNFTSCCFILGRKIEIYPVILTFVSRSMV